MKNRKPFDRNVSPLLFALALSLNTVCAYADGGTSSGGGDAYTLDFIQTATQIIYPWLSQNGSKLTPSVNANDFLLAINPAQIASLEHVFESCDGSATGREVQACFNEKTGKTYLNRSSYTLGNQNAPAKVGLVAHEVFRKLKIEGDQYEVTQQMPIAQDGIKIEKSDLVVSDSCFLDNTSAKTFITMRTVRDSLRALLIVEDERKLGRPANPDRVWNSACDVAKREYYQSTNNYNAKFSVLYSYSDDEGTVSQTAPDGKQCSQGNYLGYYYRHCTLLAQP